MRKRLLRSVLLISAALTVLFALSVPTLAFETNAQKPATAATGEESGTNAFDAAAESDSRTDHVFCAAPIGKENSAPTSAAAQISEVTAVSDGVRISWTKSAKANKVAVFRNNNGKWQRLAFSEGNTYTDKDVTFGSEYRYTVRAANSSGAYIQDDFDKTGTSITYCAVPVLRLENTVEGVRLRWKAVKGAAGYRVFYRDSKGGWAHMQDTTADSLSDTSVKSGGVYAYTVRCIAADGSQYTSYYDKEGKSIRFFSAPASLAAKNTVKGVRISWKKVSGASKYGVFIKNSKGNWVRLGTTSSASFTDETVSSGKAYTYTVRCMDQSDRYISAFDKKGVGITFIAAPVVTLGNLTDRVEIKWDKVPGAAEYRVFVSDGKGWKRLKDTGKTSVTDKNVVSGKSYSYTVRCVNAADDVYTSDFNEGKTITFYSAPKITALTNAPDGVRVTWDAVDGAPKYRVYSYDGKSWNKLADTVSTSYVDNTVTSDTVCTYTVRCVNAAGKKVLSDFREGSSIRFIAAPKISLSHNAKSITVNWNEVAGAQLYRVYYRDNNNWKKLADTKNTSYETAKVESGGTYTYTVRCLSADGSEKISDFREGKSIRFVKMPRVSELVNVKSGVKISWAEAKGAVKYCVFFKSGKGWKRVGTTKGTTITHKNVTSGKTYTYTVRCINQKEKAFESAYDETGKSIKFIAAPGDIKAKCGGSGVVISWSPSKGAAKYRVYSYKKKSWVKLAETAEPSFTDTAVSSGRTYRYTVRCISANGKSFTSGFDTKGASCRYIAVPKLNKPEYTKNGVVISWSPSAGAEKYRVYYYSKKSWIKLAETTSTKVVDTTVSSGSSYIYTVRCISSDSKTNTSYFNTKGVKAYYVSAPRLQSTDVTSKGLTIHWTKPKGAKNFRLYKKSGGSWVKLTDTTATSYTDSKITRGNTYSYTVRVIDEKGKQYYSGYDASGFIITAVTDSSGKFYYYDQLQYDYPYGDDTIAYSGCGPTCFAMIASTIKQKSITPIDAVEWCGNSYYLPYVGTYWSYFEAAADYFDITLEKEYESDQFDKVVKALKKGKYVISSQGSGRFTRGGHFIVLAGVNTKGKIIVYDPNGGSHFTGTAFTADEITEAGTHYWVFGK